MKPTDLQLPIGTSGTLEIRSAHKSEYVDAEVDGYDGDFLRVRCFNGRLYCITAPAIHIFTPNPTDAGEEPQPENPLLDILQNTPWPKFSPQQPASIQ